jgi:spore coat polysaccharide biosynthesis predicted glycosyltransferase SpsG
VVGCFNANKEVLEELAKDTGNIFLYHNVTNMVELMQKCDVAVSAGGTTISELCTVGIPTVSFSTADNQRTTPKFLDKEKIIVYAGDVVQDGDACIRRILAAIHTFSNSREMHKKYSQNMRQMVDGQGSKRIAEYLLTSR